MISKKLTLEQPIDLLPLIFLTQRILVPLEIFCKDHRPYGGPSDVEISKLQLKITKQTTESIKLESLANFNEILDLAQLWLNRDTNYVECLKMNLKRIDEEFEGNQERIGIVNSKMKNLISEKSKLREKIEFHMKRLELRNGSIERVRMQIGCNKGYNKKLVRILRHVETGADFENQKDVTEESVCWKRLGTASLETERKLKNHLGSLVVSVGFEVNIVDGLKAKLDKLDECISRQENELRTIGQRQLSLESEINLGRERLALKVDCVVIRHKICQNRFLVK